MSEKNTFTGMTALVTGASRGIGAAVALALSRRGAAVVLHYNSDETSTAKTAEQIRAAGGEATLIRADFTKHEEIRKLSVFLRERELPIDILVNNAGSLIQRTPFLQMTEDLWNQVLTLNLSSAFLVSQAVLPRMLERRRGFIVNISSVAARFGGGIGAIAYSSAKGALSTMTKGLAREFAPHGIRINAVSPGTIDTDYHAQFSTPAALEATAKATPMGRIGTPAEVADVVVFLCSEEARFIQGQVIEVNGGFLMV